MNANDACDIRIARIHAANVGACGCLIANRIIVLEQECVVASCVGSECGIVMHWTQGQRSSAAPAAHHLCCQQLLCFDTGRILLEISAERGDALMKFAKDNVASIAPQDLWLWNRRGICHLVGVPEYEFPCPEGPLIRIGASNAGAFDCRMSDAIPEPESFSLTLTNMAVLPPDRSDPPQLSICLPRAFHGRLKTFRIRRNGSDHNMDIWRPKRLFPVLRSALSLVPQHLRACRHPLLKLRGKAVERSLRNTQSLEALERKRDAHPGITAGAYGVSSRSYDAAQAGHQFATCFALVDTKQHISRRIRRRPRTKHSALNVIEFKNR